MKHISLAVMMFFITISTISAQYLTDFCDRDTSAFDFPEAQTLCSQYGENEPDMVIGTTPSSITFASNLSNLDNWFGKPAIVGKDVQLNGRLIIDIDLVIMSSNLSMGPAAWISVDESKKLNSWMSHYFACEKMWRGITVTDHSYVSLVNCKLEDAQYALSCDGSSALSLASNTFNRNYVSVRNITAAAQSAQLLFTYMGNNLFTCTGILNEPYSGQSPEPGLISHAGIKLDRAISTIGDVRLDNDFSRMEFGIHATRSDILVSRCHFEAMLITDTDPNTGTGLYADDGTAVVSDIYVSATGTFLGASSFNENSVGILTKGADLRVNKASFESNTDFGIGSFDNLISEQVLLTSNTLTMDAGELPFGIHVDRSIAASGLHNLISANTLSQNKPGISIELIGTYDAIDQASISGNTITLDGQGDVVNGILTTPGLTDQVTTSWNNIGLAGSSFSPCSFYTSSTGGLGGCRIGIKAVGSGNMGARHSFISNTVTGDKGDAAIAGQSHKNTLYCFNTVDDAYSGFVYTGINAPMRMDGNDINEHAIGLYLFGAILGEQVRKDNQWLTNASNYATWGALCDFMPEFSEFIVQSPNPPVMPPSLQPSSGWFIPEAGTVESDCAFDFPTLDYLSDAETAYLNGEMDSVEVDSSFIWDLSFGLMMKIHHNPALISTNDLVDSFYQEVQFSSAYKLAEFYEDFEGIVLGDTTVLSEISSYSKQIELWLDSLRVIDTTYSDLGDSLTMDSIHVSGYSNISNQLIDDIANKDSLVYLFDSIRAIHLDALRDTINGLETTGSFEWNKKSVLRYKVLQLLGELTQADRDSLVSIASLCPDLFGTGVTDARSLLPKCHDGHLINPDNCLGTDALNLPDNYTAPSDVQMRLSPNPAVDHVEVQFNTPVSGVLTLVDLSGKVLMSVNMSEQTETRINVSRWNNGIYLLRFQGEGSKNPFIQKLVIQK